MCAIPTSSTMRAMMASKAVLHSGDPIDPSKERKGTKHDPQPADAARDGHMDELTEIPSGNGVAGSFA